jgi:protein YibB
MIYEESPDKQITIVTAFFDIGRDEDPEDKSIKAEQWQKRSSRDYLEWFENFAQIKNKMIIYTSKEFKPKVTYLRNKYGNIKNTNVVVLEKYSDISKENFETKAEEIVSSLVFRKELKQPGLVECWNPRYSLINFFKSYYIVDAIESGIVDTTLVAWVDFGYCRSLETLPQNKFWYYPFDESKITVFTNNAKIDKRLNIKKVIKNNQDYIRGGVIIGGTREFFVFKEIMTNNLKKLLKLKLIDDDQTVMLMSYLQHPDRFNLLEGNKEDWFAVLKEYNV